MAQEMYDFLNRPDPMAAFYSSGAPQTSASDIRRGSVATSTRVGPPSSSDFARSVMHDIERMLSQTHRDSAVLSVPSLPIDPLSAITAAGRRASAFDVQPQLPDQPVAQPASGSGEPVAPNPYVAAVTASLESERLQTMQAGVRAMSLREEIASRLAVARQPKGTVSAGHVISAATATQAAAAIQVSPAAIALGSAAAPSSGTASRPVSVASHGSAGNHAGSHTIAHAYGTGPSTARSSSTSLDASTAHQPFPSSRLDEAMVSWAMSAGGLGASGVGAAATSAASRTTAPGSAAARSGASQAVSAVAPSLAESLVSDLAAQLKQAKSDISVLTLQLTRETTARADAQARCDNLTSELSELKSQATVEARDRDVIFAQREVVAQSAVSRLEDQVRDLGRQLAAAQAELGSVTAVAEDRQQRVESLSARLQSAITDIDGYGRESVQVKAALATAEASLAKAQGDLLARDEAGRAKEQRISLLAKEITRLKQYEPLSSAGAGVSGTLGGLSHVERLEHQLSQSEARVGSLEAEVARLRDSNAELLSTLQQADGSIERLTAALLSAEARESSSARTSAETVAQQARLVSELTARAEAAERESSSIRSCLDAALSQTSEAQARAAAVAQRLSVAESRAVEAEATCDSARAELGQRDALVQALREQIDELTAELHAAIQAQQAAAVRSFVEDDSGWPEDSTAAAQPLADTRGQAQQRQEIAGHAHPGMVTPQRQAPALLTRPEVLGSAGPNIVTPIPPHSQRIAAVEGYLASDRSGQGLSPRSIAVGGYLADKDDDRALSPITDGAVAMQQAHAGRSNGTGSPTGVVVGFLAGQGIVPTPTSTGARGAAAGARGASATAVDSSTRQVAASDAPSPTASHQPLSIGGPAAPQGSRSQRVGPRGSPLALQASPDPDVSDTEFRVLPLDAMSHSSSFHSRSLHSSLSMDSTSLTEAIQQAAATSAAAGVRSPAASGAGATADRGGRRAGQDQTTSTAGYSASVHNASLLSMTQSAVLGRAGAVPSVQQPASNYGQTYGQAAGHSADAPRRGSIESVASASRPPTREVQTPILPALARTQTRSAARVDASITAASSEAPARMADSGTNTDPLRSVGSPGPLFRSGPPLAQFAPKLRRSPSPPNGMRSPGGSSVTPHYATPLDGLNGSGAAHARTTAPVRAANHRRVYAALSSVLLASEALEGQLASARAALEAHQDQQVVIALVTSGTMSAGQFAGLYAVQDEAAGASHGLLGQTKVGSGGGGAGGVGSQGSSGSVDGTHGTSGQQPTPSPPLAVRFFGTGPSVLTAGLCQTLFKYDTASRAFIPIGGGVRGHATSAVTFTVTTDAVGVDPAHVLLVRREDGSTAIVAREGYLHA